MSGLALTEKGFLGQAQNKIVTAIIPTDVLLSFRRDLDQNGFQLVPGETHVGMYRTYMRVQLQTDGEYKKLEALFDSFCEKHEITRTAEV